MVPFSKTFFDQEIVFIGFNARYKWFCMQVHKALAKHGITAYPVTAEAGEQFGIPVYANLDAVPRKSACAYVITDREETMAMIDQLKIGTLVRHQNLGIGIPRHKMTDQALLWMNPLRLPHELPG